MHIERSGPVGAPVLVFIHGGGMGGWMWRAQQRHFESRFRVLLPDMPGHGRSTDSDYSTSEVVVDELAHELESLPPGTDVTVIGFSLGAQVSIALAAGRPDLVTRLIVVSGLAHAIPFIGATLPLLRLTAPLMRSEKFATKQAKALSVPDDILDDYVRNSATMTTRSVVELSRSNWLFRIPGNWAQFPGQVLLLAGNREPRPLLVGMRRLHELLPASELEVVDGGIHGISLQHPEWFNTRLDDWIARRS